MNLMQQFDAWACRHSRPPDPTITALAEMLGISRAAYYQGMRDGRSVETVNGYLRTLIAAGWPEARIEVDGDGARVVEVER